MSEPDATSPEPDEIDQLAAVLADDEKPEGEADGEPELFEVDVGPEKLKVPKAIKEAWDGMQAAHTQRSQTGAEREREIAAERAQIKEQERFLATFTKDIAELRGVTSELETYRGYTQAQWAQWNAADPENTEKHLQRFRQLEGQEKTLSDGIKSRAADADARDKLARETRQAKMAAELTTTIKDWSPAKMQELRSTAMKDYGIPAEIVDSIDHAGIVKMAHDAHMYRQVLARAAKAGKPQSNIVPITPAKGGGGKSRASDELSDKDSPEEWLRKRNAQEAKLRNRS